MILANYNVNIYGSLANPGNYNTYLTNNGGYVQTDLYVWAVAGNFGLPFLGFASQSDVINQFNAGNNVILNVNNGGHWVLLTGYEGTNLYVNDPGFARSTYRLDEVVTSGVYGPLKTVTKINKGYSSIIAKLLNKNQESV